MFYLKNEYPNNILIFDANNNIVCRFMHYDYKTENDALQCAETFIDTLNNDNKKVKDLLHKWVNYSDLDDSNNAINLRCQTSNILNEF
jgi:hypothetical protein